MSIAWMWGFEAGTQLQAYADTGWSVWVEGNGLSQNLNRFASRNQQTHQPASGFGGGRYALAIGYMDGADREIVTPANGPGSIGEHKRFVFHCSYKRNGVTSPGWSWGHIFEFRRGQTVTPTDTLVKVFHTAASASVSALGLWTRDASGTLQLRATSTTTYTGTQPYHRIVVAVDGVAGTYQVYVNGIEEMSYTGDTFAAMGPTPGDYTDGVTCLALKGGAGSAIASPYETATTGGCRFDHLVLFDHGDHSEGELRMENVPGDTETVVVGGKTYTFQATLTNVDGNVYQGANPAEAIRNLVNAINLGPGAGTQYAAAMTLNSVVTARADATIDGGAGGVLVVAKSNGPETGAISDTLTGAPSDGWGGSSPTTNLAGGNNDSTNDLALAMGDIFIQGLFANEDSVDGSWTNVNGANDGTNNDLYANLNDGDNLTDFVQTTTSPDSLEVGVQNRGDVDGTAASEDLTITGQPVDTHTVTIDGKVYTFQASLTDVDGNVYQGANQSEGAENLRRAINLDGVAGVNYAASMVVHPTVSATDNGSGVLTATAKAKGSPGNTIAIAEGMSNGSWGGGATFLSGGTENWLPSSVHAVQSLQVQRASGAITEGRSTLEIPSIGQVTSDVVPLSTAGKLIPLLLDWRNGDATDDVDGIKSGTEV